MNSQSKVWLRELEISFLRLLIFFAGKEQRSRRRGTHEATKTTRNGGKSQLPGKGNGYNMHNAHIALLIYFPQCDKKS